MPRLPTRLSQGILQLQDLMSMFTTGSIDSRSIRETEEEVLGDTIQGVMDYVPSLSVRGMSEIFRLLEGNAVTPIQTYACGQLSSLLFLTYAAPAYQALDRGDVEDSAVQRISQMDCWGVSVDSFQESVTQMLFNYAVADFQIYPHAHHVPEYQLISRLCNVFEWPIAAAYGDWVWPFFIKNGSENHLTMLNSLYPGHMDSPEDPPISSEE